MSFRFRKLFLPLATLLATACGDGDGGGGGDVDAGPTPDASTTPTFDAAVQGDGCGEFNAPASTIDTYPGAVTGNLVGAGADQDVAEGICTDERDHFAQEGEDQIIQLNNLMVGQKYGVVVDAAGSDISISIANGCAGTNLAAGECLVFADQEVGGPETLDFIAPVEGTAFLVVDHFGAEPLKNGAYDVTIVEAECTDNSECSGETPSCSNFKCVQCINAFDCTDPAAGACDTTTNTCVAGFDECTGDDPSPPESADDGPLGAVVLTPPLEGTPTVVEQNICSAPQAEADFFTLEIPADSTRIISVDWEGELADPDIDLILLDSTGVVVDTSFESKPEIIAAENLAAGSYFVLVNKFEANAVPDAVAVGYTLTVSIPECSNNFDCTEAASPVCGADRTCGAGPAECTGDDASEDNDGPAAATQLTSGVPLDAAICNTPAAEFDFYKVTVANGNSLNVNVAFDAANDADLDVRVLDLEGNSLGFSFWENPEAIELSFLPAGDYFIEVTYFSQTPIVAAHAYTITATVAASAGCTASIDCDDVFRTQLLRGSCDVPTGVCSSIAGNEALALGAACDSGNDCTSGVCSYMQFQENAGTSVCTVACANDAECTTAHGAGFNCTVPFQNNFCHPSCTGDLECGANTGSETLNTDEPWDYLTCSAGVCDLDAP